MGVDRLDDDSQLSTADTRGSTGADLPFIRNEGELRPNLNDPPLGHETRDRATYQADLKAETQAEYRAYAIEQGCDRVRETEQTVVTPEMRRIEAADPSRLLVGFDHRLKGRERLAEKVTARLEEQPDITPDDAFAMVKDAIRYTFQYPEDKYTQGVYADCARLEAAGFEPFDRRNTWEHEEYKGINSRWREPDSGLIFEVQFHTQASFEAKQLTHTAYEKLRSPGTPKAEQEEAASFQREVSARVPIPPSAPEIPDYRYG